jgi:RNase P/RNase MRP subunit p30
MLELDSIINNFVFDDFLKLETFRNKLGVDTENNDRLKNSMSSFSLIKFDKNSKKFMRKAKKLLGTKSDMNTLIKNSEKGIKVYSIMNSYENSRGVLLELVKISGKNRKCIMIKGSGRNKLTLFPLHRSDWIKVSKKTVQQWHINQKLI